MAHKDKTNQIMWLVTLHKWSKCLFLSKGAVLVQNMLLLGPDFYADSQKSGYARLFAILLAQMHMDRPEQSKCSWGKKK